MLPIHRKGLDLLANQVTSDRKLSSTIPPCEVGQSKIPAKVGSDLRCPEPTPEQEPKLPDQIADAWAAVLIDIYQRLVKREEAKPKDGEAQ